MPICQIKKHGDIIENQNRHLFLGSIFVHDSWGGGFGYDRSKKGGGFGYDREVVLAMIGRWFWL
jgi:hypothetical protein